MQALRLPAAHPAALRHPSLGGTTLSSGASPRAARTTTARRSGAWSTGAPRRLRFVRWRRLDLPGSWGDPLAACPALRPRRDLGTGHSCFGVAFRFWHSVGSRCASSHGAQSHGLLARCLRFAAWVAPEPRKTRFRLVASLAGQDWLPAGSPTQGFGSASLHPFLLAQAWPGAHQTMIKAGQGYLCGRRNATSGAPRRRNSGELFLRRP